MKSPDNLKDLLYKKYIFILISQEIFVDLRKE